MNFGRRGIRNRQEYLASKSRKRLKKVMLGIGQLLLVAVIGLGVTGAALGLGVFRGVIDSAPSQTVIDVSPKGFSSFVYDAKNNQVAKLVSADSNRIPVSGDMITDDLAHAFVAIEDERFYEHKGIDAPGILRAAVIGVTSGNFSEGASTITQQLIKNNVFTSWTNETSVERIKRKLQEQYLAIELEKTMSKDTILLNYLNTINLGHGTLGVEAASQRYFDKHCNELTVSECAVIASIPQNPTQFDPIIYPEQNKQRRDVVLNYMLNQGYINNDQLAEAEEDDVYTRIQEVNIKKQVEDNQINSYFVDALQTQILKDLQDDAGKTEEEAYALLYSGSPITSSISSAISSPSSMKTALRPTMTATPWPTGWLTRIGTRILCTAPRITPTAISRTSGILSSRIPRSRSIQRASTWLPSLRSLSPSRISTTDMCWRW